MLQVIKNVKAAEQQRGVQGYYLGKRRFGPGNASLVSREAEGCADLDEKII